MLDPALLNNFGWGAVGLAALWLVLKFKPWKNGNGHTNKSGDRTPEEWIGRMKELHEQANEKLLVDIERLLDSRKDKK